MALLALAATVPACSFLVATGSLTGATSTDAGSPGADGTTDGAGLSDAPAADADAGTADPTLVAYWSFDEKVAATATDHSGAGNDATLFAGAFTTGVKGAALALTGAGYAEAPRLNGTNFPTTGTLALWLRWNAAAADPNGRSLFDEFDESRAHFFVRQPPGAAPERFQIAFDSGGDASTYAFDVDVNVASDAWVFFTMTWSTPEQRAAVYVNGTAIKDRAFDIAFSPIGQRVRLGDGFVGAIDEVRLYRRVLSPSEIAALK